MEWEYLSYEYNNKNQHIIFTLIVMHVSNSSNIMLYLFTKRD